jgi:DNA-binding transcriptional ArsR family regulator
MMAVTPGRPVRQVADSRVLAAVAHPLRRRLMDVLRVDGPATASGLAQRTGQAVGNISHHLKVLAGCDLICEVPERARDRRERWWRLTSPALRWAESDFNDDPAAQAVMGAAASLNLDRQVGHVRAWYAAAAAERAAWGDAPFATTEWLRLTPEELAALEGELLAVVRRWADRDLPADGQRRDPVFVFAYGIPATP